MMKRWVAGCLAAGAVAAGPAAAQQSDKYFWPHGSEEGGHSHPWKGSPSISLELDLEMRFDRTYSPSSARQSQLYSDESEAEIELKLTPELSLEASITLEPVRDDGSNQYFKDHAAFIEQLFLSYNKGGLLIFAGKFNPHFGIGWRVTPGVYGDDFAEDYQFKERIGLGIGYTLDTENAGEHRLLASTFFADTTALSNSVFTRPKFGDPFAERIKRNRESYGGTSNTESLSSFTVVLDGGSMPFLPGLSYHLGYSNQKQGEDGTAREKAYVAALTYTLIANKNLWFYPMIEYAHFDNFGGNLLTEDDGGELRGVKENRDYITIGMKTVVYEKWNWSIAQAWRKIKSDGEKLPTETLFGTSVGYEFDFGLSIDVGWKSEKVEGQRTEAFGILMAYKYEF